MPEHDPGIGGESAGPALAVIPPSPGHAAKQKPRTLNSMWGSGSESNSKAGSSTSTRASSPKAPPRKRTKKDGGGGQGQLVFSAGGLSVAAPPPARKQRPSKPPSKPPSRASATSSRAASPNVITLSSDAEEDFAIVGGGPSGSQHNPVFLDDSPKRKKVDTRPAHSFFSRPSLPTHGFFANGGQKPGVVREGWGCEGGGDAPWPGGEWPSHVGAVDVVRVERLERQEPMERYPGRPPVYRPGRSITTAPVDPVPPSAISITPFIMNHPAITAVLSDVRLDDGRESWCERHRPRTADAVLGNEVEATYLRDWLAAQSVGKRAKIVRRVHRRRAVNLDTEWIVDDIGMFGEPEEEADDVPVPEAREEQVLPLGIRPDTYPPISSWLANTIVLTGPSGVGKSAAVHAVAEELGWNVFEVYPGIGKRTGAHLVSLIGDLGKNHTVDADKEKKRKGISALFAKAKGSAAEPIELDMDKQKETRQSVILIEEADLLFDERDTFWPALVALIAESRRPVVITCNGGCGYAKLTPDPHLVPTNTLPLQTVLHFQPPASYLAQAYLAAIAERHSIMVDVDAVYAGSVCCGPDVVEGPLPPNGNEPAKHFDLRAAITQMQLDREARPGRRQEVQIHDMVDLFVQLEALSVADAFVAPTAWEMMEVSVWHSH